MPQYNAPEKFPDWAEGDGALVSQPTPSQQTSGFTVGERPTANGLNWLFRTIGRSIRWLGQGVNAVLVGSVQEVDWRLLGGGSWSFSATTNSLAWSEPFTIACPGLADSVNTCAAGSVALTAGQVAYVSLNTPFATTGTLTANVKTVTDLDFESGIVAGATVSGTGVQPGTTVASISQSDSSITLSVAPTASGSKVRLVFATSGALAVSAADVATFAPSNTTAVIARCIAGPQNHVLVGLNSGQFRLLGNESKRLLGQGFVTTMRATAGAAISARQPVYLSPGASDGRTAGFAYPLDVSAAGNSTRAAFAGFAASSAEQGSQFEVVMSGRLGGFSGLTPGATYYANPTAPLALQASKPSTVGQWVAAVGTALSADQLFINAAPVVSQVVTPNYAVNYQTYSFGRYTGTSYSAGIAVSPDIKYVVASSAGFVVGFNVTYFGTVSDVPVNLRISKNYVQIIDSNIIINANPSNSPQVFTTGTIARARGLTAVVAGDTFDATLVFGKSGTVAATVSLVIDPTP